MYLIVISFLSAFGLTYYAIPSIISVAKDKDLFVLPGERSSHTSPTPALGGIAIVTGAIFSIVLWTPFQLFANLQYILSAFIILFLIGVKDDLAPMSPGKKMTAQLLAAAILIYRCDIRLYGLYGVFGLEDEFGQLVFILFSFITIIVITNAFNLLDGIDGLAGSISALIMVTLGVWFFVTGSNELTAVAFASAGAVTAFLRYNYTPARIFMGDTGSLFVGLVCAILIIRFINDNHALPVGHMFKFNHTPAVAIGIIMLPLFDTLRVFIARIARKGSPFKPDRRHIHHMLIDYGYTHMQATMLLIFIHMMFTVMVFSLQQWMGLHSLLALELGVAITLTIWLYKKLSIRKVRV